MQGSIRLFRMKGLSRSHCTILLVPFCVPHFPGCSLPVFPLLQLLSLWSTRRARARSEQAERDSKPAFEDEWVSFRPGRRDPSSVARWHVSCSRALYWMTNFDVKSDNVAVTEKTSSQPHTCSAHTFDLLHPEQSEWEVGCSKTREIGGTLGNCCQFLQESESRLTTKSESEVRKGVDSNVE